MVSSVSEFPALVSTGYDYKPPQLKFGQIILCVTLAKSMKSIISILPSKHLFSLRLKKKIYGWHSRIIHDSIYLDIFCVSNVWFYSVENVFQTTNPYIYDSKGFTFNPGNSKTYEKRFETEGKVTLTVFAKSANFGKGKYNLNNDVQIQYMKLSNFPLWVGNLGRMQFKIWPE